MDEKEMKEWLELGLKFHGHICGGMPLGFRAGLLARETLGVEREPNSRLVALAETGEYHLAGCWVDGIMLATGCTYGKGNIHKLFFGKWAVTLVDPGRSRAIRVSVRNDALEQAFNSPFLKQRLAGVPPSEIDQNLARAQFDSVAAAPNDRLFQVSAPFNFEWKSPETTFAVQRCAQCGEITVTRHMRVNAEGKAVCAACLHSPFDYPEDLVVTRGPEGCCWPTPDKT